MATGGLDLPMLFDTMPAKKDAGIGLFEISI